MMIDTIQRFAAGAQGMESAKQDETQEGCVSFQSVIDEMVSGQPADSPAADIAAAGAQNSPASQEPNPASSHENGAPERASRQIDMKNLAGDGQVMDGLPPVTVDPLQIHLPHPDAGYPTSVVPSEYDADHEEQNIPPDATDPTAAGQLSLIPMDSGSACPVLGVPVMIPGAESGAESTNAELIGNATNRPDSEHPSPSGPPQNESPRPIWTAPGAPVCRPTPAVRAPLPTRERTPQQAAEVKAAGERASAAQPVPETASPAAGTPVDSGSIRQPQAGAGESAPVEPPVGFESAVPAGAPALAVQGKSAAPMQMESAAPAQLVPVDSAQAGPSLSAGRALDAKAAPGGQAASGMAVTAGAPACLTFGSAERPDANPPSLAVTPVGAGRFHAPENGRQPEVHAAAEIRGPIFASAANCEGETVATVPRSGQPRIPFPEAARPVPPAAAITSDTLEILSPPVPRIPADATVPGSALPGDFAPEGILFAGTDSNSALAPADEHLYRPASSNPHTTLGAQEPIPVVSSTGFLEMPTASLSTSEARVEIFSTPIEQMVAAFAGFVRPVRPDVRANRAERAAVVNFAPVSLAVGPLTAQEGVRPTDVLSEATAGEPEILAGLESDLGASDAYAFPRHMEGESGKEGAQGQASIMSDAATVSNPGPAFSLPHLATGGQALKDIGDAIFRPGGTDRQDPVPSAPTVPFSAPAELKALAALLAPKNAAPSHESTFIYELAERIQMQLRDGQEILRVQLKPNLLGRLEIRAENSATGVVATITAETAAVKACLEDNLHQLQQCFQDQGLKVDRIQVTVQQEDWRQHPSSGYQESQSGSRQQENAASSRWPGRQFDGAPEDLAVDPQTLSILAPHSTFHTIA